MATLMTMKTFEIRSVCKVAALIVGQLSLVLTLAFALCHTVSAQAVSVTLAGTVTDETGAVVPDAEITLASVTTGLQRHALTNREGAFQIPLLDPGDYTLTAELPGFAVVTINDVRLQAGVNASLQIVLKPKALDESMDVLGTSSVDLHGSQINLKSSSLKYSLTHRQVAVLPVFTSDSGRNTLGVLPLVVPGVTPTTVFGSAQTHFNLSGSEMSINGARPDSISFYLDGGDNNDREFNHAVSPLPNPDALQEFTVVTNNYQADLGRSAGGILNAVIKSGTSRYRGNLRYFLINDLLNARSFFDPHVSPDKLNTFGGQLGGPLWLPGVAKPRTFFFADYEGTRTGGGVFTPLTVLAEKERNGDFNSVPFTAKPIDPLTGRRFPNFIIPASRLNPIAQTYLQRFVPLPDEAPRIAREFLPTHLRNNQAALRLDHEAGDADRLSATYFSNWSANDSTTPTLPIGSKVDTYSRSQNLVLREAHIFSPRLVSQFTAAVARLTYDTAYDAPGATGIGPRELGFTGIFPQTGKFIGVPAIHIEGTNVSVQTGDGSTAAKTSWQVKDDLTMTRAAHLLKVGGELSGFLENSFVGNNNGSFEFGNNPFGTGNAIADFLLGIPSSYTQTTGTTVYPRQRAYYVYAMDDWQLRANLTVNLGVRYELAPPLKDKLNQVSVFRPGQQSAQFPSAASGLLFPGDRDPILSVVPRGLYPTDKNNFAPRFGLSYAPAAKSGWRKALFGEDRSVLHAGAGLFYDQSYGALFTEIASTQPFSVTQSFRAQDIQSAGGSFANPFGHQRNPWPLDRKRGMFVGLPQLQSFDPRFRTAYTAQYNLSLQRELPWALLVEVAYVGTRGANLNRARQLNTQLIVQLPYGLFLRPRYPQFGGIVEQESSGRSRYDALQLHVKRRFSSGLMFDAAYVFSKVLDDGSGPLGGAQTDALQWARSAFDRRHNFVMSYAYDLPGPHTAGLIGRLAGGWQIGGITEFRSGLPMDISQSYDSTLTGQSPFSRPDFVGPFVRLDPRRQQTIVINGVRQTGHFFFDPRAFRPVKLRRLTDARAGNLGRNVFDGPGLSLWSLSINKQIRLACSQQLSLRADIRNLFNHANFQTPGLQADVSATFGQVFLAAPGRTIQLSLKYSF